MGVGGAFKAGVKYVQTWPKEKQPKFIGKIDADMQHDANAFTHFLDEATNTNADYFKGNRYLLNKSPVGQPSIRLIGNAALSFMTKLSTGYWSINDPLHGHFLINFNLMSELVNKNLLEDRYLFETSILTACCKYKAVVKDVLSEIVYAEEVSSLSIRKEIFKFFGYHTKCTFKRIISSYLFPNFDLAGFVFLYGLIALLISLSMSIKFLYNIFVIMEYALPSEIGLFTIFVITGIQSIFFFILADKMEESKYTPISRYLR